MSDIIRRGSRAMARIIQSAEERKWIYGTVGTLLNGVPTFDVRGRAGYIYVTIRQSNGAQTWPPARNDANVPHALGLPVRMYVEGTTYVIESINRRNDLASGTPGSEGIHTHDNRYFTETEHISTSAGAGDAGKPIVLDAGGHVDVTMLNGADIAAKIHAATLDTTPLDADEVPSLDSSASFALMRTTWTNIKAFLKTYFDTLYARLAVANVFTATPQTVGDGTSNSEIAINTAAGQQGALAYKTAGVERWRFIKSSSAESGSNAGSNWEINRFDDAGSILPTSFRMIRSTGYASFGAVVPAAQLHLQQDTPGEPVFRIDTNTAGTSVNQSVRQNRVTTTNATVTTLHTIATGTNNIISVRVVVLARRTGGASGTGATGDGAECTLNARYKNVAGTVTLIGAITKILDREAGGASAAWDANLTISGTNILVEVTGAASMNVTWHLIEARTSLLGT